MAGELTLVDLNRASDPALRPEKSDYYFAFYDDMFAHRRQEALNILEVGILRGGSTLVFAKAFANARILAVDIQEPPPAFYDALEREALGDRVSVTMVSQSDPVGLTAAIETCFGEGRLDIVIDDASHLYDATRSTFDTVFGSYVKPGGTYVIEDWGCGYWASWPDGNPDGRHGLPRLVKELIDLVALSDRTMLVDNQRALPVQSQFGSPIGRAVLTGSISAFVRSDAVMPDFSLLWGR
jgi:hypothetical protein